MKQCWVKKKTLSYLWACKPESLRAPPSLSRVKELVDGGGERDQLKLSPTFSERLDGVPTDVGGDQ